MDNAYPPIVLCAFNNICYIHTTGTFVLIISQPKKLSSTYVRVFALTVRAFLV